MKILVTGAAGFIGYHFANRLLDEGFEVVGIDNINDYYDVRLKYARLASAGISSGKIIENQLVASESNHRYRFAKTDMTDYAALQNLFSEEKFDVVVHLAAQAGVRYSLENPHAYIASNVVGFMNLLECCRAYKPQHLVYASSSSVYGNSSNEIFSENDNVDYPVSLYAATKKSNELMAHTYSHLYQLPTTGLRFFTVYGEWGRPDMSPILFAKAIRDGQPIKVFNHGDMSRDFTYIDDIVGGMLAVMNNAPTAAEEHPYYRLYNIGNSEPVQLLQFIETMEKAMGGTAVKEMLPMQPGDVQKTYADTSRLTRDTGYKPDTPIAQGVQKFAEWYKNQDIV
ncbi:MAG: NAD-dependent epimerase/dehydratase family protein [Capnocytophaga sp.]|nr:NAD-dependent epimerase/dehydratase family protein [Capnocytophaga sp.]